MNATSPPTSSSFVSARELVRFVRPGPRYTSYPPATEFGPGFGAAAGVGELARLGGAEASDEGISLYCHVPFCSQLCWYCGCNVTVSRDRARGSAYVDTLIAEIEMVAAALGQSTVPLAELSLGGGSPNFLYPADLTRLVRAVDARFERARDAELGIELDPRDSNAEQLAALAACGFTRMSVGVQDFDEAVQRAIHREQSVEQTANLIESARELGFRSANVDLVYGLPAQTADTMTATLDAVLACRPDRIALFGYAHLPHLRPHQRLVERGGAIPGTEARADLLGVALERFAAAGYVRIGMDHFALPGDPLVQAALDGRLHRNFQGYVVRRGGALIGCGASAITDSGGAYWQNHVDVHAWETSVKAGELPIGRGVALDADDQIRRWVITRLMCDNHLDMAQVDERFAIHFESYFADELRELTGDELAKLVELDSSRRQLVATELGANLIRNVCMTFDRYLSRPSDGQRPRFSPTL